MEKIERVDAPFPFEELPEDLRREVVRHLAGYEALGLGATSRANRALVAGARPRPSMFGDFWQDLHGVIRTPVSSNRLPWQTAQIFRFSYPWLWSNASITDPTMVYCTMADAPVTQSPMLLPENDEEEDPPLLCACLRVSGAARGPFDFVFRMYMTDVPSEELEPTDEALNALDAPGAPFDPYRMTTYQERWYATLSLLAAWYMHKGQFDRPNRPTVREYASAAFPSARAFILGKK